MREITQIIYEFKELSEEVQEKLIKQEIEYQKEAYCESFLKEDMEEKAKKLLEKYFKGKAIFSKIYYSLNYCQGDGAMIEFELEYYGKLIYIKHDNYCRYYHERSFCIEYPNYDNLTENQEVLLTDKIEKMNEELARHGYELIEQEHSREEIIDLLSDNEYYADGTIY